MRTTFYMIKHLVFLFMKGSKILGNSREKLYQELGLQSKQQRQWYRKLCSFFKIIKNQPPKYLFELIPTSRQAYMTRHENSIPIFNVKHYYFKKLFFHFNYN